jgi:hypothetical protein
MYIGADFLIDRDLNLYLSEVNTGLPAGAQEYDLVYKAVLFHIVWVMLNGSLPFRVGNFYTDKFKGDIRDESSDIGRPHPTCQAFPSRSARESDGVGRRACVSTKESLGRVEGS